MDIVPESFSCFVPTKPAAVYKFAGEAGSGEKIRSDRAYRVRNSAHARPIMRFIPLVAEEVVGSQLAAKLTDAIKSKCSNDEIMAIVQEVSDEEQDQQFNSLRVSGYLILRVVSCTYPLYIPLVLFFFLGFRVCADALPLGQQELLALVRRYRQVSPRAEGE